MRTRPLHPSLSLITATCVVVLAAACGGDDDAPDADADAGSASIPAASVETAAPSGAVDAAPGAGEGPTIEELTALAAGAEVAGFEAGEATVGGLGDLASVTYRGDGVEAFVTLSACDPFVCWDLDGEVGPDQEANLRSNLAPVHLENPDLVFEYGNVEPVPGYEAFFMYSFSFIAEDGSKAATNSYRMIYHDGAKSITVVVQPESGFLPDTAEEFQAEMEQSTGATVAGAVLAAYADAFDPVS